MARTITEIFESIKAQYVIERATAGLVYDDPAAWSKVNLKRLIFYVVAAALFVQEQIYDKMRDETNADLANLRPPTVAWYAQKCLAYQHGFPIIADTDQFDNTGYSESQIEASKVIKYAAVQRQADTSGYVLFLRIKICGESGAELAQLDADVIDGFNVYLQRFQAAGDNIQVMSKPADSLKMKWQVYINPGILDGTGGRLDGTATEPVKDAILAHLKTGLPFNGKYSITAHIDAVQKVLGVVTPRVLACSASFDALPYVDIAEYYQPNGGWLRFADIDTDLEIEYLT